MIKQAKTLCSLVTLSLLLGYASGAAASASDADMNKQAALEVVSPESELAAAEDTNTADKADTAQAEPAKAAAAPITLEGEEIYFDEKTGDVYAKGNVIITQDLARLYAEDITGNTIQQQVEVPDKARVIQPGMDLDGHKTSYNYGAGEGTMETAKGRVGNEFVQGESIEFYPDEYIIYNGTMTKCPAKKPDYVTKAKKIEIWPDEKLIAYDAKFVLKGVTLYSTKRYETAIGKNAGDNSPFPRIGYSSDDGFYLKQDFRYQMGNSLYAYYDAAYYTKADFKPMGGLVYNNDRYNYTFRVDYGYDNDTDDNWIKKRPQYKLDFHNRRIKGTSWSYHLTGLYGLWEDSAKKSWHQDYELYFSRQPIKLTDSWTMNVGAGYEIVRESYDESRTDTVTYDVALRKRINDRMNAWSAYHHSKADAVSIFDYDSDNIEDKLSTGMSYRFDDKNSLSLTHVLDLEKGKTNDWYYTWYHSLHCWNMYVTYHRDLDDNDDKFSFQIETAHW